MKPQNASISNVDLKTMRKTIGRNKAKEVSFSSLPTR